MVEAESKEPKESSSEQDSGSPSEFQVIEKGANPPPRPSPVSEVPDPPPVPNPNVPVQKSADLTDPEPNTKPTTQSGESSASSGENSGE